MTGQTVVAADPRPTQLRETSSVIRTALLTVTSGGVTFLITNGTHQDTSISITLSILIGGIALLVRFLVDFEKRLVAVEKLEKDGMAEMRRLVAGAFGQIGEATRLYRDIESSSLHTELITRVVRSSTKISPESPPIVLEFAKAKMSEMAELFELLTKGGTATYNGEDRDWLLGLTKAATKSIDAISMAAVDHDLWQSEIGLRYLDAQGQAAGAGKRVRRIFMLDEPETFHDPALRRVYREQREILIQVRMLAWRDVPARLRVKVRDRIIFDDILAYESMPTTGDPKQAQVAETRLILKAASLAEYTLLFGELWDLARELPEE
ncbi:hypothetical protein GCM10010172_74040 [Paractinoplanes ferrugineus]|uniref:Uncharacterized protein n=1 Tax=Paractinoplanes ferrugineus TaxID=113564 RepID=A0A919IZ12_9ACTN|nr:hypothetical protein [Actinoplanes ferrugineus]GIE11440.1 hypothetical protein Afe05nite_32800 [Actinoplanes ferrugineus]